MQSKKIDSIIFFSVDQASFLSFMKHRYQILKETPLYTTHDLEGYLEDPSFKPFLVNINYAVPIINNQAFIDKFEKRFSQKPLLSASQSYDAVKILARALSLGFDSPEQISSYIKENVHQTVSYGDVRFDQMGQIDGGEFEIKSF